MNGLPRDMDKAAGRTHDLLIVGGGIYGAMVLYEAARRGLSCLLLERGDFGAATSRNNFRILHGGLRYLQTLDLRRFRESVVERRWFLRHFPQLAEPLPCLMPLYGRGLKRRSVLSLALRANDLLSADRNRNLGAERRLARGEILSSGATLARFPFLHRAGLTGAALWHDAIMPRPQRILMETLRQACVGGRAQTLDHCAAQRLRLRAGRVTGVTAKDGRSGESREFWARAVVNAAGPWVPEVAERFGTPCPELYPPTLAWNLGFDRPAPFAGAIALTAPEPGAQTLFLLSCEGRLLAGTGHAPWHGGPDGAQPDAAQIDAFLAALNAAAPGLDLRADEIEHVYAGLLPGRSARDHRLRDRPMIVDHGRVGGPQGLWSVSGVKFTTARRVADALLRRLCPEVAAPAPGSITAGPRTAVSDAIFPGGRAVLRATGRAARRGGLR